MYWQSSSGSVQHFVPVNITDEISDGQVGFLFTWNPSFLYRVERRFPAWFESLSTSKQILVSESICFCTVYNKTHGLKDLMRTCEPCLFIQKSTNSVKLQHQKYQNVPLWQHVIYLGGLMNRNKQILKIWASECNIATEHFYYYIMFECLCGVCISMDVSRPHLIYFYQSIQIIQSKRYRLVKLVMF